MKLKKFLKVLSLVMMFVLLLSLVGMLSACKSEDNGETDSTTTVSPLEDYILVRPDAGSDEEIKQMNRIKTALKDKVGVELSVTTDYVGREDTVADKEILIGKTLREESQTSLEGLRSNDFVIKKSGEKIVVVGGSDNSLIAAVDYLIANLIDEDVKDIVIPENEYLFIGDYGVDSVAINGVDLSHFKIYTKHADVAYGKKIQEYLSSEEIGYGLKTAGVMEQGQNNHYLIIEKTELVSHRYGVYVDGNNLVIRATNNSIDEAIEYFCTNYLISFDTKNVNITEDKVLNTGATVLYTKEQLLSVLTTVYNDPNKIIVGEQCSAKTTIKTAIEKFEKATGQKPGLVGFDMYHLGDFGDEMWSEMICEMVNYASNGGIITLSCHWYNPSGVGLTAGSDETHKGCLGTGTTKAECEKAFSDLITVGTEYNTKWMEEVDRCGKFMKALQDSGVPVLWRPFHEMNGNWFWWCVIQNKRSLGVNNVAMDASAITNMWRYLYNYYTDEMGLTDILWVYAPNANTDWAGINGTSENTMMCYPGDGYVDIASLDWYTNEKLTSTTSHLDIRDNNSYTGMMDTGKIGGLSEFGFGSAMRFENQEYQERFANCIDLLNIIKQCSSEGMKFAYTMSWTGDCSVAHFGKGNEFMADSMTMNLSEVKQLFDSIK